MVFDFAQTVGSGDLLGGHGALDVLLIRQQQENCVFEFLDDVPAYFVDDQLEELALARYFVLAVGAVDHVNHGLRKGND